MSLDDLIQGEAVPLAPPAHTAKGTENVRANQIDAPSPSLRFFRPTEPDFGLMRALWRA